MKQCECLTIRALFLKMSFWECGWQGVTGYNMRTRRKASPSDTVSTTNTMWTSLGPNPNLRYERPATNRLRNGTVEFRPKIRGAHSDIGKDSVPRDMSCDW